MKTFQIINTEKKAYWLGFIAADGSVTYGGSGGRQYDLRVELAVKDKNHLELLRKFIGKPNSLKLINRKYASVLLRVCSKQLVKNLIENGVPPAKTHNIVIPKLNSKLLSHWVRGYFDGDGNWSIGKDGQLQFAITSGSQNLLYGLRDFLVKECKLPKVKLVKVTPTTYRLSWKGNRSCEKLFHLMYKDSTIFMFRKHNKATTGFAKAESTRKRNRGRRVVQKILTGKVVAVHASAREAARKIGVSDASISHACNGQTKTCKGFILKWE